MMTVQGPPLVTEDAGISHEKPMEDDDVQDVGEHINVSSEGALSDDAWHLTDDDEETSTRKRARSPNIDVPQPTIPKKPRSGSRVACRKISISRVGEPEGSR